MYMKIRKLREEDEYEIGKISARNQNQSTLTTAEKLQRATKKFLKADDDDDYTFNQQDTANRKTLASRLKRNANHWKKY